MRNRTLAVALMGWTVVMSLAVPGLAGPGQAERVAASAQWVAHMDAEGFLASKVGAFVLEQIKKPEIAAGLAVLKNVSGLDLTKDLKAITLYGVGAGEENGVALIEGSFEREKLLTLLRTNPTLREIKVSELDAYQWTDEPKGDKPGAVRFGLFFRDDLIVVAGSQNMLEQAVAVLQNKQDSMAQVVIPPSIKPSVGAYLFVYLAELPRMPDDQKAVELLSKFVSGRFEIGETERDFFSRLTLLTKDAQTASNLSKMADGVLGFLDLVKDLRENGKPLIPAEAAGVLKDLKVSAHEASVEASLVAPRQNVVDLLKWVMAQAAAKPGAS
ncbi:MAG TPA: hypothetical protein PKY77_02425 [Phycisphaerae bacterium]|nr:hypothetical protein [Phycisphaerae bacterium]HRY66599.1 hypothetical protein [Phycisphaerae bacterium]HSA27019.1 hypothetical protein [Phycisphaerae bacterium]